MGRFKPHIVLIGEEAVVERQANGVGTGRGDKLHVAAGDVVVFEKAPKFIGEVRSHHLAEHFVDEVG